MQKTVLRDVAMLAAATAIGWWAHGANTTVQAQHSNSAPNSGNISFQFGGTGQSTTLSLYNADTHMLYVYPTGIANSTINCAYRFHIDRPGAAIDRQNCELGSPF
jgi:hypothetical protein